MPNADPASDFNFSNAPGSDISFDDLFPSEEQIPQQQSQVAAPEQPSTPPAPPQAPETPVKQFFLKTPTGTVYETEEDLIRGISHKDQLLETLRQELISRDGIDPLTKKPIRQSQAPEEINYAVNGEKFYDDLAEAVRKNDRSAYARTMQRFIDNYTAPVVPILADVAKSRAVDSVSAEVQDFREFYRSPDFSKALDAEPLLKAAIQNAEGNLNLAPELPGLYRLAYWASQGRKAPEIARHAVAQQPPVPTPPVRPTTSSATMTPPPPAPAPDLRTSEGRKALIADYERRGIADRKW